MDKSKVRSISNLARIKVSDEEVEELARELSEILTWIDELSRVDTESIRPMTSVIKLEMPAREDTAIESEGAEKILRNAPEQAADQKRYFTVPKVIE